MTEKKEGRDFDAAQEAKQLCDCGHPVGYHREPNEDGHRCCWNPPKSHLRCACKAPTTTGVERLEVYNSADPNWKPWKGWPGPVLP